MPQRLPIVDGDDGDWGTILNQYLSKEHYDTGADNAANGGHKTITIRPGTNAAGTAPLKFTDGPLLTTPEAGAVEFNNIDLYFTPVSGLTNRRVVATIPTTASDFAMHYIESNQLTTLPIGSDNSILRVNQQTGAPTWTDLPQVSTPTAVFGDSVNTSSVAAGTVCYVSVPYAGTISKWTIVGIGASAACVIDVWKRNIAIPTVTHTIDASAKPTLIAGDAGFKTSTALTGWTTAVSVGDVFGFKLDSVSGTVTSITLTLEVKR